MTTQILWRVRPGSFSLQTTQTLILRQSCSLARRTGFGSALQQSTKTCRTTKRWSSYNNCLVHHQRRRWKQRQQPPIRRGPHHTSCCSRSFSSTNNDDDQTPKTAPLPSCILPYTGMPSHPDVIDLEPGQRLVAIGDVHGDFSQLLEALILGGLVAEEEDDYDGGGGGRSFVWTGGTAILVQIGDVLDRGPHELACWQLLAELSRQAETVGGKVVLLHGNHELWTSIGFYQLDHERYMENLDYDDGIDDSFEVAFGHYLDEALEASEGDWRAARVANDLITTGITLNPRKVAARWAATEPGGLLAEHFLSKQKIAVKVGDTVLVHAGIVPEHLDRYGGIAGMNDTTKRWILKKGPLVGRHAMFVPPNDPEGRLRTYVQSMPDFFMEGDDNAFSPIWMRDYSDPRDDLPNNHHAYEMLDTVLRRLKASRMVVGHTPQSRINAIMNGKAWRIDVGMSRGMEGTYPEVLEVSKGEDGEETVWVLTAEGKVPAEERYIVDDDHVDHPASD